MREGWLWEFLKRGIFVGLVVWVLFTVCFFSHILGKPERRIFL